jgi:hypothetical protein
MQYDKNKRRRLMNTTFLRKMIVALALAVMFGSMAVHSQTQDTGAGTTLTGIVSDALCGAKHSMMGMSAADCTRMCVKGGQSFALVVGDKVYNLRGDSAELDKYAGQKVTLKGKLRGNAVTVDSVTPAK